MCRGTNTKQQGVIRIFREFNGPEAPLPHSITESPFAKQFTVEVGESAVVLVNKVSACLRVLKCQAGACLRLRVQTQHKLRRVVFR
jgi:hypothetical protein